MNILEFLTDQGDIWDVTPADTGKANLDRRDIFGNFEITNEAVEIQEPLAPIATTLIFGTGLNYKRHVKEVGMPIPQYPVLFVKGLDTLQHPGDPIVIPRHLWSNEMTIEIENISRLTNPVVFEKTE
jgi:2-keto-4-pentenoate hydratase/2-oxohepta-3-ene-1,7-dioic acid hydratase in catechol pathway